MIEHVFVQSAPPPAEVTWQASLFGLDEPAVDPGFATRHRRWLAPSSWIDHAPRWLSGSDRVFAELVARVAWRQRVVKMYDRMVDEPRLTWWCEEGAGGAPPLAVLGQAAAVLSAAYDRPFDSIGFNFYRDGRDSVAWHGDRVRHTCQEPVVAIVSVGAPRPFLLRPRGGGASLTYLLGQGDLMVMGGACQHDWEHCVPKVSAAGPRISIMYRHGEGDASEGRARSSSSRNGTGAKGVHHRAGVRVQEHPAGTEASWSPG
jgi:alkylated DNA repair dioxygenase AlkB